MSKVIDIFTNEHFVGKSVSYALPFSVVQTDDGQIICARYNSRTDKIEEFTLPEAFNTLQMMYADLLVKYVNKKEEEK